MPSVQHQAVGWALRAARVKSQFTSPGAVTRRNWLTDRVSQAPGPPATLRRRLRIREVHEDDSAGHRWATYDLSPPNLVPDVTVVYLHGGAYVNEMSPQHWLLVGDLVRDVPARVLVARYPLAPAATAEATVAHAAALVDRAIEEAGAADVVVMGDSAGAGLALAALQVRRDAGAEPPARRTPGAEPPARRTPGAEPPARRTPGAEQPALLALISPWLDVTMTDPEQAALEPRDPMLARPGLAAAGALYAGDLPVEDPRVSPLFGSMAGLPPMLVLTSTADLLLPDARRLRAAARAAGVQVDYHEAPDLYHDYAIFPVPEGARARARLVGACQDRHDATRSGPGVD